MLIKPDKMPPLANLPVMRGGLNDDQASIKQSVIDRVLAEIYRLRPDLFFMLAEREALGREETPEEESSNGRVTEEVMNLAKSLMREGDDQITDYAWIYYEARLRLT